MALSEGVECRALFVQRLVVVESLGAAEPLREHGPRGRCRLVAEAQREPLKGALDDAPRVFQPRLWCWVARGVFLESIPEGIEPSRLRGGLGDRRGFARCGGRCF